MDTSFSWRSRLPSLETVQGSDRAAKEMSQYSNSEPFSDPTNLKILLPMRQFRHKGE